MSGYETKDIISSVEQLEKLPCDMADECRTALEAGTETAIEYRRTWEYNQEPTHYLYFPEAGRGAVCTGGNSDWTDCTGLDDLEERWANYEEQWSN